MQNFVASNGLYVSYRSRYRTTTYFDVFSRTTAREIGKHDDGRLTVGEWTDEVSAEEIQAIAEYEADEAQRYAEWRERNARLFA